MAETKKPSLDSILADFKEVAAGEKKSTTGGAPIAIWLPAEDKARYDRLQNISGRGFSKKVRELIQAAMDLAESKTA